jgi:hypothetical protein
VSPSGTGGIFVRAMFCKLETRTPNERMTLPFSSEIFTASARVKSQGSSNFGLLTVNGAGGSFTSCKLQVFTSGYSMLVAIPT